jgi:hypothetical protein
MGDFASDPYFVTEALEEGFVVGRLFGKKFQGDGLTESKVIGAIDFAHAAPAEERDDAVASG